MKKLLLLLILGSLTLIPCYSQTFTYDGLSYNITSETELTVEVIESQFFLYGGDIIIPETVIYRDKTYAVTSIGGRAFQFCSGLTSIKIPNSVISIGEEAFYRCNGLTSVEIPNSIISIGEEAFSYCEGLTNLELGNSVTSIGKEAFRSCWRLTNIEFPNSIISIGERAFYYCSGLTSVEIPNSIISIGGWAFSKCTGLTSVKIDNAVISIGDYCFCECGNLESVEIGNSVTSIGKEAFQGCEGLTGQIDLPQTIEYIGSDAFTGTGVTGYNINITDLPTYLDSHPLTLEGNDWDKISYSFQGKSINQLIVPMGTKGIKGNAFRNCTTLQSIIIPDGIESIGDAAFRDCGNLNGFSLPETLNSIGESAFENCIAIYEVKIPGTVDEIKDKAFKNCQDLELVTIGNGVKKIGAEVFYRCNRMVGINLPSSIAEIGDYAFYSCSQLTTINFPDNLEILGERVFEGTHLVEVKLNGNLKSIGAYAFSKAATFTNLHLPQTLESIGIYAFQNCGIKTLVLPDNIQVIGYGAFSGCQFTEIKIPSSLNAITYGMFMGCSNLKNVEFNDHIQSIDREAFYNTGIRILDLPQPIVSIGERAFANSGLVSITFPETLTSIGAYAFENTDMVSYEIPNSVTSIGANAFGNLHYLKMGTGFDDFSTRFCSGVEVLEMVSTTPPDLPTNRLGFTPNMVLVPEGAGDAYLANNRWKDYNIVAKNSKKAVVYLNASGTLASEIRIQTGIMPGAVTNLIVEGAALSAEDFAIIRSNMPACYEVDMSGVANTSIPSDVFSGKTGLLSIALPNDVKEISDNAFVNCYTAKFTIPETLETIGSNAFANCQSMDNDLKFAKTLKSIGSNAFDGCRSLRSVDMSNLEDLQWGNDGTWGGYAIFQNCYALSEVVLPSKLSTIPPYIFSGTNLETVVIPSTAILSEYAFYNCFNLKQVSFEDGFDGLGNNAFYNCSGLYAVVMPESVTKIGSETFRNCTALQNIVLPRSLNEIGYGAFAGSGLNYIEIPASVKLVPSDCFTQSEIVAATIDGSTEIGSNAFGDCPNLLVINLPYTLKTVSGNSLNSRSLSAISSPSLQPAATNDNPFADVSGVTCALAVPKPSFTPYLMAEYWGKFVSIRNSIDVSQINYDTNGNEISEEENAQDPASELTYMDEEDYQEMLGEMEEENESEPLQSRRKALRIMKANGLVDVNKGYGKLFNNASLFLDDDSKTRFFLTLADDVISFSVNYNGQDITNQVDLNTMSFVIDGLNSNSSLIITTNGHVVDSSDTTGIGTIDPFEYDDENAPYYNLNGLIVKNPTPGIYIRNGKKVVVK